MTLRMLSDVYLYITFIYEVVNETNMNQTLTADGLVVYYRLNVYKTFIGK